MQSDCWIAVGLESQVQPSSSNPAIVQGQALAVWRGEDGPVNVWEDRCPHRGMRLSFGFVRDNTLRCIYHGWGYATDGQCVSIPAHPDLKPPKTICANSFPAESRYGIVWTNLSKTPSAPPPDFGPDEGWAPVRSVYVSRRAGDVGGIIDKLASDAGGRAMLRDNVASVEAGPDLSLLIAVQPMDEGTTGLHVVARGAGAASAEARLGLARKLERLRTEAERS